MGLDATVRSIITENPDDEYFDKEYYEHQVQQAEMLNKIAKENGCDIDFRDRPDVHVISLRIGSYSAIHFLRRFAAELDGWDKDSYRKTHNIAECNDTMNGLYDNEYYLNRTKYPHLINHCDCEGYYLPLETGKPFWVDGISIGSSITLKNELRELWPHVKQLSDNHTALVVWKRLYRLACLSVRHKLPIIFQ